MKQLYRFELIPRMSRGPVRAKCNVYVVDRSRVPPPEEGYDWREANPARFSESEERQIRDDINSKGMAVLPPPSGT